MADITVSKEISTGIFEVINDTLDVEDKSLNESTRFIEDLGADSLDQVELVMNIEEKFGIDIDEQEAQKILTVEDAMKAVSEKLSN